MIVGDRRNLTKYIYMSFRVSDGEQVAVHVTLEAGGSTHNKLCFPGYDAQVLPEQVAKSIKYCGRKVVPVLIPRTLKYVAWGGVSHYIINLTLKVRLQLETMLDFNRGTTDAYQGSSPIKTVIIDKSNFW